MHDPKLVRINSKFDVNFLIAAKLTTYQQMCALYHTILLQRVAINMPILNDELEIIGEGNFVDFMINTKFHKEKGLLVPDKEMFFYDKLANNYAQKPNAEKIKIKE
jgi:hypothetical protein